MLIAGMLPCCCRPSGGVAATLLSLTTRTAKLKMMTQGMTEFDHTYAASAPRESRFDMR